MPESTLRLVRNTRPSKRSARNSMRLKPFTPQPIPSVEPPMLSGLADQIQTLGQLNPHALEAIRTFVADQLARHGHDSKIKPENTPAWGWRS